MEIPRLLVTEWSLEEHASEDVRGGFLTAIYPFVLAEGVE